MMDDFIGTYGNNLIVAVVGVGVALLVLAIALWLLRRRSGSAPFIRGGRNRQPRLQVLDATAVDARRRLVLVRRDNVEHLVMIGGPTDIVIESGIGAIPIVRDVQEPELKALPRQETEQKRAEPSIPQERRPALPQQQPVSAVAPASVTEEPIRQAQRPDQPAPAPVAPPVVAQAKAPEERPTVLAPPVFAAREPAIDQSTAADFLDAARERVLPGLKPGENTPPAPFPPKPENPAVTASDAEPKFSDDLASDFESFLEAEIAKSKDAEKEPEIAVAPEQQPKTQPVSPPVTGTTPDGDMQKEMARIFGELSVTRDR